jgi:DMSO/TMAO reductase YedYZ molybdopterin-dependent catalytic subunit
MPDPTFSKSSASHIGSVAVTRQQDPPNVEYAFAAIESFITPVSAFYVRSHFKIPALDASNYRLKIDGAVDRSLELTLDELKQMQPVTRPATLECAGNGRVFLVPPVSGAQWELGAVSTANWTGVPLADVLSRAGLKPEAVEIIFQAADKGHPVEHPIPPDEIHYAHSIPIAKIPDAMLVYAMNGKPLTAVHGFPLRVVIPGWYGMASVKWVTRIIASPEKFRGYFRTVDYAYWSDLSGHSVHVPIEEMAVKAQISRPAKNEVLKPDQDYLITGAAWSGESEVAKVEVSTNGGADYQEARLIGPSVKHAWRLWEQPWRTPSLAGPLTLYARATDQAGRTQPIDRNKNNATYMINHVLPTEVVIA